MESRNVGARPDLAPTPSPDGAATINVTPLIDVLLVLLVTFFVAAGLSRRTIPVQLPDRGLDAGEFPRQILLELSDDGRYLMNGQPVPRSHLADVLAATFLHRPVKLLFIRTGPGRGYQEFIEAADIARGAGVMMVAEIGQQ